MVRTRLRMILSEEDYNRLVISESASGRIRITADVHGMKCYEVNRLIKNIIILVNSEFSFAVIHGYNHGTAIKDMLAQNFKNSHVREQYQDSFNKGLTHMLIAA